MRLPKLVTVCTTCGATIVFLEGQEVKKCRHCHVVNQRPQTEKVIGGTEEQLDNADNYLRAGEYDSAEELYDYVIRHQPDEHRAYWGKLLCKYGIQYVEDGPVNKILCHYTRDKSFVSEPDFKRACEYADEETKAYYELEGERINAVQMEIRRRCENEKPYDIYLCYKETDPDSGERTKDSTRMAELYDNLTEMGYRVFYARKTLYGADVSPEKYEAVIYHAIHTARLMIVFASKAFYLNTDWVKSEWTRYQERFNQPNDKASKRIVPLCEGILEEDLPVDLRAYQVWQWDSLIGLLNNIKRWVPIKDAEEERKNQEKERLYKLANDYMGNKKFNIAAEIFESLGDYSNSVILAQLCRHKQQTNLRTVLVSGALFLFLVGIVIAVVTRMQAKTPNNEMISGSVKATSEQLQGKELEEQSDYYNQQTEDVEAASNIENVESGYDSSDEKTEDVAADNKEEHTSEKEYRSDLEDSIDTGTNEDKKITSAVGAIQKSKIDIKIAKKIVSEANLNESKSDKSIESTISISSIQSDSVQPALSEVVSENTAVDSSIEAFKSSNENDSMISKNDEQESKTDSVVEASGVEPVSSEAPVSYPIHEETENEILSDVTSIDETTMDLEAQEETSFMSKDSQDSSIKKNKKEIKNTVSDATSTVTSETSVWAANEKEINEFTEKLLTETGPDHIDHAGVESIIDLNVYAREDGTELLLVAIYDKKLYGIEQTLPTVEELGSYSKEEVGISSFNPKVSNMEYEEAVNKQNKRRKKILKNHEELSCYAKWLNGDRAHMKVLLAKGISLNVRETPHEGALLGTLSPWEKVQAICATDDNWMIIEYKDGLGYASGKYLVEEGTSEEEQARAEAETKTSETEEKSDDGGDYYDSRDYSYDYSEDYDNDDYEDYSEDYGGDDYDGGDDYIDYGSGDVV